jgi:hypothetical protein
VRWNACQDSAALELVTVSAVGAESGLDVEPGFGVDMGSVGEMSGYGTRLVMLRVGEERISRTVAFVAHRCFLLLEFLTMAGCALRVAGSLERERTGGHMACPTLDVSMTRVELRARRVYQENRTRDQHRRLC